jgi:hypothetical protein
MVTEKFVCLCLGAVLACTAAAAQEDYFPLAEGNRWELRFGNVPMSLEVGGRPGPNYRVQWDNPWNQTVFVFARSGNQVLLTGLDMGNGMATMPPGTVYFDFGVKEGGSWSNSLGKMTVISRSRTVATGIGRLQKCIAIQATNKQGASTYWTFAPGVGPVQFGEGKDAFILESRSSGGKRAGPAPGEPAGKGKIYLGLDANPSPNEGYGFEQRHKRFRMAVEAGMTYTSFSPKWDEMETAPERYRFDGVDERVRFAEEAGIPIALDIRVIDGDHRSIPAQYRDWSFDDARMAQALQSLLRAAAPHCRGRVKWLALGNEVDHYFDRHRSEVGPYTKLLDNVLPTARQQFPGALFTVNFSEQRLGDLAGLYRPITSKSDFYSYNYYPLKSDFTMREPDVVKEDMNAMIRAAGQKQVMFQELGYASSDQVNSSEEKQARFVQLAFEMLRQNRGHVCAATFVWMSDLPQSVVDQFGQYYRLANSGRFKAYLGSLGMFDRSGRAKAAWAQFQREARNLL